MLWAVCFGSAAGCSEVKTKKFGAWLGAAVVLLIAPAKAGAAPGQASVGAGFSRCLVPVQLFVPIGRTSWNGTGSQPGFCALT